MRKPKPSDKYRRYPMSKSVLISGMNGNKRIDFKNALAFVLDGNESDLSGFSSDEDNDDEAEVNPLSLNKFETDVDFMEQSDDLKGNDEKEDSDENVEAEEEPHVVKKKHVYRWRKKDIPKHNGIFTPEVSENEDNTIKTQLEYFKMFWSDKLTDLVVENTNLYSTQKSGSSVNTSRSEIEQYIGMHIKMGVISLPAYTLYWSNEMRYPPIAEIMSLKRFQKLRRFLHFVDNSTFKEGSSDKLFKIKPIVEGLRDQCVLVKPEELHSIDEQIIPSKTKFTKIRQYNPKKPVKWGFKNLVRAGASGIIYDFYIYTGKANGDDADEDFESLQKCAQVVARLCKDLPSNRNHRLLFDNWFTTLDLLIYLKKKGILACGTVRSNRLQGCPLQSNKEMKKAGRGSIDYKSDMNSGIVVTKWCDNNCVHIASNFVGTEPIGTIERWCTDEKARKQIPCPRIILVYNEGMGGVDLSDMLISLYRIVVKTKRWYVKIFWHCIDISKVNAWLLYRRHCQEQGINRRNQLSLLQFILKIADALIHGNRQVTPVAAPRKAGRPPKRKSLEVGETTKRGKKPFTPPPRKEVRQDKLAHWPEIQSTGKGRCRQCGKGFSRVYCIKCGMCLCLTGQKNCFFDYHSA